MSKKQRDYSHMHHKYSKSEYSNLHGQLETNLQDPLDTAGTLWELITRRRGTLDLQEKLKEDRKDPDEENDDLWNQVEEEVIAIALTQMSPNKRLHKFREKGAEAATDELRQVHNKDTFVPVHKSDLSPE